MYHAPLTAFAAGLLATGIAASAVPVSESAAYCVSPTGADTNPGAVKEPFATLERARDAVRALREAGNRQDVTVLLRGGTYPIERTVVFGLQDSAPPGAITRFEAFPGETPVLSGAQPVRDWRRLEQAPARLNVKARGRVWVADVRDLLRTKFPEECRDYDRLTDGGLLGYLRSQDPNINSTVLARLLAQVTEYMPLTDEQWAVQTPENRKVWEAVRSIEQAHERLLKQGADGRFSPEWIDLILQIGHANLIQERPVVSEAVAPFVVPSTPETRRLSAAEAREQLERDWLHQADGKPTPARIRSEIQWARELAERIGADVTKELAELDTLAKAVGQPGHTDAELYYRVRDVKRRIVFWNPIVSFRRVLFVDMPYPGGSESHHETRHRLGYMAVPGARLLTLDGLSPDGNIKQLIGGPVKHTGFARLT